MADQLLDKLTDYYSDDPNVTVIVDRRKASRRELGSAAGGNLDLRDRRRHRVPGELPPLAADCNWFCTSTVARVATRVRRRSGW